MKIYCILLDGVPLFKELNTWFSENDFKVLPHVAASSFTKGTLYSYMNGGVGSKYYYTGTSYLENAPEKLWFKGEGSQLIWDEAYERGFDVIAKNSQGWLKDHIFRRRPFVRYDCCWFDSWDESIQNYWKNLRENDAARKYIDWLSGCYQSDSESKAIQAIQGSKKDVISFAICDIFHDVLYYTSNSKELRKKALDTVMHWVNLWQANEPDALFWFFSDHGQKIKTQTAPSDYMTWAAIKDNKYGWEVKNPFIYAGDFSETVRSFLQGSQEKRTDIFNREMDTIMMHEDARAMDHKTRICTQSNIQISSLRDYEIMVKQNSRHVIKGHSWAYQARIDVNNMAVNPYLEKDTSINIKKTKQVSTEGIMINAPETLATIIQDIKGFDEQDNPHDQLYVKLISLGRNEAEFSIGQINESFDFIDHANPKNLKQHKTDKIEVTFQSKVKSVLISVSDKDHDKIIGVYKHSGVSSNCIIPCEGLLPNVTLLHPELNEQLENKFEMSDSFTLKLVYELEQYEQVERLAELPLYDNKVKDGVMHAIKVSGLMGVIKRWLKKRINYFAK